MVEISDAEIDAALKRGRTAHMHEPRAASARYDRLSGRIVVDLANGCTFAFSICLVPRLNSATDEKIAAVELLGAGYGLHWEALDLDLSLPGLMAGRLGTEAETARLAGQATAAKASSGPSRGTPVL
ncbi:DUF2442 domain-containing protein [Bosea sp. OK403]|uniref:DUF2442 domain-containing protein n=1 Tax=Bosea sp. OK403 TaxID=1855286 RepID=UPI000B820E22|nr:DUF2442 domain-containing protein [Bosea sp. OK403]